jgi:undecaprenyl-phosphate 4-deoxy-4-formamido-L-arabinose transferase
MTVGSPPPQSVSVVIPVFRGATTLEGVVTELLTLVETTAEGTPFEIVEVILVHDDASDSSDLVMRHLNEMHDKVVPVWLSRNFGQHAATIAGISRSSGDWIVTLDEDGQFDPEGIARMLDTAVGTGAQVVYARPVNSRPHGVVRNAASWLSRGLSRLAMERTAAPDFHSFRLILGVVGREVAARVGPGVYLDVALTWVVGRYSTTAVVLRGEVRQSAYTPLKLLSHFRRLVVSTGTRSLRAVTALGVFIALGGAVVATLLIVQKLTTGVDAPGWTSLMVAVLMSSGAILLALGVIAEYIGVTVGTALGRPAFLIVSDPASRLPGVRTAQPSDES